VKKLFLVDDHKMFTDGIRFLLEQSGEYELSGVVGRAADVFPFLAHTSVQVLALDIDLPDGSGFDIARQVRITYPHIQILALSMLSDIHSMERMMQAGATGYCVKSAGYDQLLEAIQCVAAGETYLPSLYYEQQTARQEGFLANKLSEREGEIIRLIVGGASTTDIAERLCISPRTVETHRKNIYRKLGVHTNVELTHVAIQRHFL
jgi:DNA-binding NarL/FixJ family response regulator